MVGPGRTLVAHLPAFRLERCGYLAEEPAALTAEQKSAVRLVALTPAAAESGLRVGMTATEARALLPEVLLEPWDPASEDFDRQALLQALVRFTDKVHLQHEADFSLQIAETVQLFGGEQGLIDEVRSWIADLGHACRVAIADDPLAASALAGWGDSDTIVEPGQTAQALAALPIAALRPSEPLADSLRTLGIAHVAEWAALDPASVAGRFGAEGVRLHRTARGETTEALAASWIEVEPVVARVVLGGPTATLEPLFFVLPGLLRQISTELFRRNAAAVRLALRFVLEDGPARVLRVRVGRATRDHDTLARVIRARLEGLELQAPVVELQIEVEEDCPEPLWQLGLHDRTEAAEPLDDLLARLTDTLGEAALCTPELVDDWCPERAWRPRPPTEPAPPPPLRRARIDPVEVLASFERELPLPRPTLLLPSPQPLEVRARAGRPDQIRREEGWLTVLRAAGPEYLRGRWWDEVQQFDRAYWVVSTRRETGWIFEEHKRWFWHGWFD